MSLTAVLRDGSRLPERTVTETMAKLEQLHSADYNNFIALVEHCKNKPNDLPTSSILIDYPGHCDGRSRLPNRLYHIGLLDGDRKVSQTVRTILLNSVEERGGALQLTNPVIRKIDEHKKDEPFVRDVVVSLFALFLVSIIVGIGVEYTKRALR